MTKKAKNTPVRVTKCATCPFKRGSKYAYLKKDLTQLSHVEGRHCHSTGSNNAINHRTGVPPHLCRGSRDVQLKFMHAAGFISDPTDEAWNNKRVEYGWEPIQVKDPDPVRRK